jgi:V/A-type H+-transporting ATPase subunit I
MKKVSIITIDNNIEESLEKLGSLGVVHIEKKDVSSEKLVLLLENKKKLEKAEQIIISFAPKKQSAWQKDGEVPKDIAATVLSLYDKRKELQEQIIKNSREISRIEAWGDFDLDLYQEISKACGMLYPYELTAKSYAKIGDETKILVLKKTKTKVFCFSVGKPLDGEVQFALPNVSLHKLKKTNEIFLKEIYTIEENFSKMTYLLKKIKEVFLQEESKIEFEMARAGREIIDREIIEEKQAKPNDKILKIAFLQGYIPITKLQILQNGASEAGLALYVTDPEEGDRPPVLIKNNAFIEMTKPLFSFLGTIPGYNEYDIGPSFLIFFCIFFAMIFGDAAYGTIIFITIAFIGFYIKAKTGKIPDAINLFALLSISTIVWGAINGSWFAMPQDKLPGILKALIIPQFKNTGPLFLDFFKNFLGLTEGYQPSNVAQWNVQFLCFGVAVIQLVYSHIKNIKRLINGNTKAVAVSQAGWLVMMIGLYFLVLFMLLKIKLPAFTMYLIGGGLGAYFVFANQTGGNVFLNIGKSFANILPTFLNVVGSFADIISYIRLFAVGLAGSSIAQSFNSMSGLEKILEGNFSVGQFSIKIFGALLILILGHGLNMMMNVLSVIVHGIRLNLLEYAGNHLGMEWSGYSYKPFVLKQEAEVK